MFTQPKSKTPDIDILVEQALSEVPNLNASDGPAAEVHKLARLRADLTAKRKTIVADLEHCSGDGPMGGGTVIRYDAGLDSKALLAGAPVDSLTAPAEETMRGSLLRRLRAIDLVLSDLPGRIVENDLRIVGEEFAKLRPAIAQIIAEVVRRCEAARASLQALSDLDQKLGSRGLPIGRRPTCLDGYGSAILFGASGQPPLAWFIDNLRKIWGLNNEAKN